MILAIDPKKATAAEALLKKARSPFYRLGMITAAKPKFPAVRYV